MNTTCTEIVIKNNMSGARILTSASLLRSDDEDSNEVHLFVHVRLPDSSVELGWVARYDSPYDVIVVNMQYLSCIQVAGMDHHIQSGTRSKKVIAIGRVFETGKLMASSGDLTEKRNKLSCIDLRDPTCVITKAGIGGPLMDFDGQFIGMNFYDTGQTPYLPGGKDSGDIEAI
ncbi:hypothetical protein PR202_ga01728 [Eleusine coracana subsp. coracana]|uniref:Uncharacterized protein n=1 Tax=Eleusine coracana subsp. coracana TaxID=191504 RepID=A0AAV5BFS7_ELECO|nr:hypothetical protein PR202_ga01041 [Eleusine coracana subsp. coracana]GJM85919.1 hypothetical protein PR202_ga01728 [Eleusine coracana subsp. coracana]